MKEFGISNVADVKIINSITGDVEFEGQALTTDLDTDKHCIISYEIEVGSINLGIDKDNEELMKIIDRFNEIPCQSFAFPIDKTK
ncbi:hypothetical protein ACQKNX_07705 [Lysinibacillus sp. NPDC093712]|uniref:hypothetical protein n=1 Tax=Lysinibacillus sp. NPDC093712 TaxID=3390579 RepID=UPI003D07CD94